jgi:sulfur carrier protein ThiS
VGYTSDCQYIPSPALLQVPERIKITVSGKKVDVTQSHILNIELATVGLEDNEVEIKLDGAIVSKTKASSKAVELDLTDVRTGEHQLQAYSKISDVELTSLPLAVSVDNPDFEKRLTEKKKESNRESTVAAARKLYDALYDHSGKVGHIRGLAVVEGASVVFGDALPISLVMRKSKEKGEGEIWVDNELDVYTKESIASALLFAQKYYTYNVENYTEVNDELLTLITPEYQDVFKKITRDGLVAAQSAKAESKVESVQITEVDKLSANQAKVQLTFKAQTTTNHQTTENRYSTKLDLQKKEGHWKINAILSEQPVEFLNIRNLL